MNFELDRLYLYRLFNSCPDNGLIQSPSDIVFSCNWWNITQNLLTSKILAKNSILIFFILEYKTYFQRAVKMKYQIMTPFRKATPMNLWSAPYGLMTPALQNQWLNQFYVKTIHWSKTVKSNIKIDIIKNKILPSATL